MNIGEYLQRLRWAPVFTLRSKLPRISEMLSFVWIAHCLNVDSQPAMRCRECTVFFINQIKILPLSNFNKANLRDLIAATGLVILLKLDDL